MNQMILYDASAPNWLTLLFLISVKSGYPPKALNLSGAETNTLKTLGLRSGDTLIIEELKDGANGGQSQTPAQATPASLPPPSRPTRKMVRK